MENAYIYTLTDPRKPDAVRYVGVTTDTKRRFKQHLYTTPKQAYHAGYWLKQILSEGFKPAMSIVEIVTLEQWEGWEQFWISHFKSLGHVLTNTTAGGRGLLQPSEETRTKIGQARKGKPLTEQQRAALRKRVDDTPAEERSERSLKAWETKRANHEQSLYCLHGHLIDGVKKGRVSPTGKQTWVRCCKTCENLRRSRNHLRQKSQKPQVVKPAFVFPDGSKTCVQCGEDKPFSDYHFRQSRGKAWCRPSCKQCFNAERNAKLNAQKAEERARRAAST